MRVAFLVSLPRSGSTLLQRMLSVSPEVASAAETWLMLPLAYMLRREGAASEYTHLTMASAVQDMADGLPGGRAEFVGRLGEFAQGVYERIALAAGRGDAKWFLDKTPRYYLIVPFLAEAFPDARFVFLFRHPVDVLASMVRTWHGDRFGAVSNHHFIDLAEGPRRMTDGLALVGHRGIAVHYESLVSDPAKSLAEICGHLGISYDDAMVSSYREVRLQGHKGDPTGVRQYAGVATESLGRWRGFVNNHVRRRYVRGWIGSLEDDVLRAFGVDRTALLAEIDACPVSFRGDVRDLRGILAMHASRLLGGFHLDRVRRERREGRRVLPYI